MCTTCGCSDSATTTFTALDQSGHTHKHTHDHEHHHHTHDHYHTHIHDHAHGHSHDDGHTHQHLHQDTETIELQAAVLAKNDNIALDNRRALTERGILALNFVSSPGSGKTTLLVKTLTDLLPATPMAVIEGDQETLNDAKKIQATGASVIQVNTGTGCHLEADMVRSGIQQLDLADNSILLIENVGNLVCPALFDLGEAAKVAILSVTEGEDKPIKYPHMFRAADLVLLTKTDLLPHLNFDVEACIDYARQVNPNIQCLQLSAQTGAGLDTWYDWIQSQRGQVR
ncbi:MAG: hydrogenase nickel incorporation protein HypB [Parvibaculaceae bacterium]